MTEQDPWNALPSTAELQMGSEIEAPVPELGGVLYSGGPARESTL